MSRPPPLLVRRTAALLSLFCLHGLHANAMEDSNAPEPAPNVDRVVVHAQRPMTATSTTTVPAGDYELRPLESGGQMLESVPGVLTAQHTGGGKAEQYFLRGFDADHGTDLAVYFDGVPINLRSHAHGHGYLDLHFVIKETVERLDVAKGPYSPRFGDFTTAGKIEYIPYDDPEESEMKFEVGSWDTYRAVGLLAPRGSHSSDSGPDANGLFSIEAYHTDGPFQDEENLRRVSLFGRGYVRPTSNLELSGHLVGYAAEWDASGLIPERLVEDDLLSRFASLDPTEGGDSRRVQGKLQLDWEPTERGHLLANAYVAHYELDLFSNFTFALADPATGDGIVQHDDRIYTGGRVEYTQSFDINLPVELRTGLEWRFDDARVRLGSQTRRETTDRTSDDDLWELSIGPYVQLDWRPASWVHFMTGLRFERYDFEVESRLDGVDDERGSDQIWLPKANLVLAPFESDAPFESEVEALRELELYLNYGTGFHSNDVRSSSESDDILARAHGAEVGLRTRLFDRVSLSLGGFWLEIEKELGFVGDEGTTETGGRTRRLGVEVAGQADLLDWLYLHGDVAYTQARFTSNDDPVAQAPRFVAKGALAARLGGWAAELSVRSLGSRYATEESRSPKLSSYTVLDAGARYREGPLEFGFALENLTGTKWRSSEFFFASCAPAEVGSVAACPNAGGGEGIEDFHFTPGSPRTARVWVRYAY